MTAAARDITLFIDPWTHHFDRDVLFDVNHPTLNKENSLAPTAYLRQWFRERGIGVHTADRLVRGEVQSSQNIYVTLGIMDHYRALARRSDVVLSALFAMECPIVEPSLYTELTHAQSSFKRIFSWTDSASLEPFVGGPLRLELFQWPQNFDGIFEAIWGQTDRKFLVMINTNKLPRIYNQELYTERVRAVEFFSRKKEIDLYGVGWDGPPFRTGKTRVPATLRRMQRYGVRQWRRFRPDPLLEAARSVWRGPAASKPETLGKYTFTLCFENQILNGWITEKLFDCFFVGTVPIYWGAPDIQEYVPGECYIDMRRFSGYPELREYLKSLTEREIHAYREAAREFLKSPQYQPFTKEAFVQLFARIVEEDTGIHL